MSYTTTQLLHIIPLDESLRTDLLQSYEAMSPARKYEISVVVYDGFDAYLNTLANSEYQKLLIEVETGDRKLTTDLMEVARQRAYDIVDRQVQSSESEVSKVVEAVQMDSIRDQLLALQKKINHRNAAE